MTTRLAKPLRRRVGDVVIELGPEGITFRFTRCRRRVLLPFADAIEVAVDRAGYRPQTDAPPAEQLRFLRRYRREQPRSLFPPHSIGDAS